jgi:polar amino acid transport system substrate-binding protein
MKRLSMAAPLFLLMLVISTAVVLAAPPADTLAEVRKRGVLVAGVKDAAAPFGYADGKTGKIVGYDIDFVNALAARLGVTAQLVPVTSANRIPQLQQGNVDIVAASMTKTIERAQQIDFSYTYFLTGQKFITRKGKIFDRGDLKGKKVGTVKGSASERNLREEVPAAVVMLFDDYPQAMQALEQGELNAITTDEPILAALLAKSPRKEEFEIPRLQISTEPYGLGIRKGDQNFLGFVNDALLEMEQSGEAQKIYDRWFGPNSEVPIHRGFKITSSADASLDTLAEVRRKGVLVAGVKDNLPPFSFVSDWNNEIIGYDIDFAKAIAREIGVRLELKPLSSADRIPRLKDGSIDIIAATLTRTPEREREIDFSYSYFFSGQKFLARKGTLKTLKDLAGKKVGTATGTTSLEFAEKEVPEATIVLYDDYFAALKDLEQGKLFAVTTGEAMLAGLLSKSPMKDELEIPRLQIHVDIYGLGMRRGDKNFIDLVNKVLLEMEKSGEAKKIFEKWFGENTNYPLNRNFKISAGM